MDKLKKILERCKCGVFLTVNEHRDYYQTAKEYLDRVASIHDFLKEEIADKRAEMEARDTIITLQFYPDTPISFEKLYDSDIDRIMDRALGVLQKLDGWKK